MKKKFFYMIALWLIFLLTACARKKENSERGHTPEASAAETTMAVSEAKSHAAEVRARYEAMEILSEINAEPDIETRKTRCGCGGSFVCVNTDYGDWQLDGTVRRCIHDKQGGDAEKTRSREEIWQCSRCGGEYRRTLQETGWACRGYTE